MARRGLTNAVAGVSLAALLGIGLAGCSSEEPEAASPEAGITESVDAPEVIKDNQIVENDPLINAENIDEVIKSFEISADLDPEGISKKITDNINRWASSGATPEYMDLNVENWGTELPFNEDLDRAVALENAEVYAEAMFGHEWRNSPNLTNFVNSMLKLNQDNLLRFRLTYVSDKHPAVTESNKTSIAYTESWSKNTEVINWIDKDNPSDRLLLAQNIFGNDDVIVLDMSSIRTNNADDNHFGNNETYAPDNGSILYWHSVVAPIDSDKYIVKHINYDPNKDFVNTY